MRIAVDNSLGQIMMTLDEQIEILQAKRAGKVIQCWCGPDNLPYDWRVVPINDTIDFAFIYRIKPEEKKKKKVTLVAYYNGSAMFLHTDLKENTPTSWLRVPAEDKTIEVDE